MPDERRGPDWIHLAERIEDLGLSEDPGKYIDGPLDPFARIRGINSLDLIEDWREVATEIARIRNEDPDDAVLEALDEREQYLTEHGEHDPELPDRDIVLGITADVLEDVLPKIPGEPSRFTPSDEPTFDEEGTPYVWDPERVRERLRERVDGRAEAVAADGGEAGGE